MRTAACVAGSLAIVCVLSAQERRQSQPIRVGTNLVRVDAYPIRDGKVVSGLQASEFEVLEDGVPQKIETFEQVVPVGGPLGAPAEPSSQRDMVRAIGNPRNRVFLIFLDGPTVTRENAIAMNEPLKEFVNRYLDDNDLVGVMTSGMSISGVAFGRKTDVFEAGLRNHWSWGRLDQQLDPDLDRRQIQYGMCYPRGGDVGTKMIARSRERATLEALQDAVRYLHSIREERKAIVTVTQGWVLYREDPDLLRLRQNEPPIGSDKVLVGPNGKLTLEDPRHVVNGLPPNQCDADRTYLATIDNERFLRDIIDDANRGNASFYMIDPGGVSLRGSDRNQALRTLAENTDGFAFIFNNDLASGMRRIADDLSSYYLLGYYATNSKPDGRFRTITVRVKQPGVQVRARKGYRAPTEEELAEARRSAPAPTASRTAAPVAAALDRLGRIRPDARFHVSGAAFLSGGPSLWVAGEVQPVPGAPIDGPRGWRITIDAVGQGISTSSAVTLKPGERTFLVRLDLPAGAKGQVDIRAQLVPEGGGGESMSAAYRMNIDPAEIQPVFFRRGPTTGNRLVPAADPRFSRTERMRAEIPVGDATSGVGRVLDRAGQPLQVPVTTSDRLDTESGQRWVTADVNLAALSPGDYVIAITLKGSTETQSLIAIRVTR